MPSPPCVIAAALLALLTAFTGARADTQSLRILTPFPASFYEPFRAEFMKRHPEITVEVIQRKTPLAVRDIIGGKHYRADIFWASAPDAFEALKQAGQLAPIAIRATSAPATVSGYPVNDPAGTYLGFALSRYGIVYSPAYLSEHSLPAPASWADLARPLYAGHIGMSTPWRSGTTHLMVEAVLQQEGWDRGWALWSEIGGNLSTVTARSFGVSAGVANGRFGIGLSIDFLARPLDMPVDRLRFVVPPGTVFAPASIAIVASGGNRAQAEMFVDFVLSGDGQNLLQGLDLTRSPLAAGGAPEASALTSRNPKPALFDAALSARRYELVNILFDEMITIRRAEVARLWQATHELESRAAALNDAETVKLTASARAALSRPLLSEAEASDPELLKLLVRRPRGLPAPEPQAQFEARMKAAMDSKIREATTATAAAQLRLERTAEHRSGGAERP